ARLDPGPGERLFRLVVLVPVVRHRGVTLDAQVADLALRHGTSVVVDDHGLVARHGPAGRARARRAGTIGQKDVQDLRRANAIDDLHAEALPPARVDLLGQRLAGRDAQAQRR